MTSPLIVYESCTLQDDNDPPAERVPTGKSRPTSAVYRKKHGMDDFGPVELVKVSLNFLNFQTENVFQFLLPQDHKQR